MIAGWVYGRVEWILNRQIAASLSAAGLAAELEGHSCRIIVDGLGVDAVLRVDQGRVSIDEGGMDADVTLRGTPFDLLHLMGPDAEQRLRSTGASLEGQIRIAEKFAAFMRLARPDLEDELATWTGDVAAHAIGNAVRRAGAWTVRLGLALRDDTADYLKEESRILPGQHEAEALYAQIEGLRDDVERVAARLERLLVRGSLR